jgi:hypothetical protein
MLIPIIKTVNELIPIRCKLALKLKNKSKNEAIALIIPPIKKEYNSGKLLVFIVLKTKIDSKKI